MKDYIKYTPLGRLTSPYIITAIIVMVAAMARAQEGHAADSKLKSTKSPLAAAAASNQPPDLTSSLTPAGAFSLKGTVGYVYSFGGNNSGGISWVGYGASFGWTNRAGFGISADYIGFNDKWASGNAASGHAYNYNIVTLSPNYRVKLDSSGRWGLRLGLGVGVSILNLNDSAQGNAQNGASANVRVAAGADYNTLVGFSPALPSVCNINQNTGNDVGDSLAPGTQKNRCNISGNSASNADIATWLRGLGVTSPDGMTLNINNTGVYIATSGTNGGIAPEVACIVNGGNWNGAIDSATATKADCVPVIQAISSTNLSNNGTSSNTASGMGIGFIITPQAALEYDNSLLHADINLKYLHQLFNARYFGSEASGATDYNLKAGPLALFIGAGIGVNF
ncbi:MAG: hypothetical protein QM529_07570 [Hydrotalea sp.]|nr:hypothetical protein [Hydrotalea sp.]